MLHPDVDDIYSFAHQAAPVAAQVEDDAFHVGVVAFQPLESLADILGGVLREFVKADISHIPVNHTGVRNVGEPDFGTGDGDVELFAFAFQAQGDVGAGLSAHGAAHVGVVFALGAFSVHGEDSVAYLQSGLVGRQPFVRLGDVDFIALLMDEGADAAILSQHLHLDILHVALGKVVGIGVHRSQHGVDGHLHGLSGVNVVNIVGMQVLVNVGKNLQIL